MEVSVQVGDAPEALLATLLPENAVRGTILAAAGVENTRGDTLERRGTMCEGTRGRRGGAGDGAGAAGGESGRKLAVQLVRVSFSSLPRKLCLAMAPAARRRSPAAPGCYRAIVCAWARLAGLIYAYNENDP